MGYNASPAKARPRHSRLGRLNGTAAGSLARSIAKRVSFSRNLFPIAFSRNRLVNMEKRDARTYPIGKCMAGFRKAAMRPSAGARTPEKPIRQSTPARSLYRLGRDSCFQYIYLSHERFCVVVLASTATAMAAALAVR